MSIQTAKAFIIYTKISTWSGSKADKKATREVNNNHGVTDAGKFMKRLVDKAAIRRVRKYDGIVRDFVKANTLPWGDNGDRILPAGAYFNFTSGFGKLLKEFNEEVDNFVANYEKLVAQAQTELNGLFNPDDYPNSTEIREKFGIKYSITPLVIDSVENVDDIRLKMIPDKEVAKIQEKVKADLMSNHNRAIADMFERTKVLLDRIYQVEKKANDDKRKRKPYFKGSLFEAIKGMIDLFPTLNYTNDPKVNRLVAELKTLLVDPANLKKDDEAMKNYINRAKQLEKMFFAPTN